MKTIKNLPFNEFDFKRIKRQIEKILKDFYRQILIEDRNVINTSNALMTALIEGKIVYRQGIFRGEFNSQISAILKKMGAKWGAKGFYLSAEKVDSLYLSAIAQGQMKIGRRIADALTRLGTIKIIPADVAKAVDNLVDDICSRNEITVNIQLDEIQRKQIKEQYTENIERGISGLIDDEVVAVRKLIEKKFAKGERYESFVREVQERANVSDKRAAQIAKQETNNLNTEVKKAVFQKAGFNRYVWKTRRFPTGYEKGNVRPDHAELDGLIFDWDNPPIVDQRTGYRAHPAQAANCRCVALPVIE